MSVTDSFVYASLVGGRWGLLGPVFFAAAALGELHHIIKTVVRLDYFPGAVTAIAYVAVGILLLRAVVREFRNRSGHIGVSSKPHYASG